MSTEEKKKKDHEYYLKHKEEIKARSKKWAEENKDRHREIHREIARKRRRTPYGRAYHLLQMYNTADKKYGRGQGDLTPEWIMENIFTKPCIHCGKTGWKVIGCNRIDNTKPHSKDNVEPCCKECNTRLATIYNIEQQSKKVYQYTLNGELVKIWDSVNEAGRSGFQSSCISLCCNGGRYKNGKWMNIKQHKGYKWSYEKLLEGFTSQEL